MTKKLEDMADEASDVNLAKTIIDSANQIWLAGLGAFSKTQEEGAKVFEALVKEGEHLQKRARKVAGTQIESLSTRASEGWEKLEQVFEGRVAQTLSALNVPTKRDLDALAERVAKLTEVVDKLSAQRPAAAPAKAMPEKVPEKI